MSKIIGYFENQKGKYKNIQGFYPDISLHSHILYLYMSKKYKKDPKKGLLNINYSHAYFSRLSFSQSGINSSSCLIIE